MTAKKMILYKDRIFIIDDGVYEPDRYSFFLEENIEVIKDNKVLDLVTGSGFFAIMVADRASQVVGVDINPKSVRCAKMNAMLNNVDEKIDFRIGDIYSALAPEETFDLIIANPPEFPTPAEKVRNDWFGVSNLAGPDGRKILDNVLKGASKRLNRDGRLLLWHAWYANIPKTMEMLDSLGFEAQIIAEKHFKVGLLTFERSSYLREIGLPLLEIDGELMQYHVIILASKKILPT